MRRRLRNIPVTAVDLMAENYSGKAVIEDGCIVIRLPVAHLPQVVDGGYAAGAYPRRYHITNLEEFVADLVRELNDEQEDGTTPIHELFDGAIIAAVEQGALGIEEHPEQFE